MTRPGFATSLASAWQQQAVAILAVDAASNTATALTRRETQITIDLRYHVGSVQLTPSVGEQWYVKMAPGPTPDLGVTWMLVSKIPFNTPEITLPATEGQQQIGTGKGPVQLHGTQINANGPLRLANANSSLLDSIERKRLGSTAAPSLPAANTIDAGSLAYNGNAPVYSDGTNWTQLGTYDKPAGGIPTTDLTPGIQSSLTLANSAYQVPTGGIPASTLASGVQNNLALASTALQNIPANSVGLDNLIITGQVSPATTLMTDGTTMFWGTPSSSQDLQNLLNGLEGGSTGTVQGVVNLFGNLFGAITGVDPVTALPQMVSAAQARLQYLSPNGLLNSQALDSDLQAMIAHLNSLGQFDAAQLFNLQNISSIPQTAVTGLVSALSDLVSLVNWNNLLMGLFGTTNPTSYVLELATIPELPISLITGLATELGTFLGISDWNSFLSQANLALGTDGSDLGHLIIGLGAIPQGNITGLATSLGNLLPLGTWNSFLSEANTALGTAGTDLAALVGGLGAIPQGNITGLATSLGALLPTTTWTSFLSQANTALGTTGSDLAHLITGLGAIPPANITGLVSQVQHLTSQGLFDASQLTNIANIPAIAQSSITGLVADLGNLLPTTQFNSLLTNLFGSASIGTALQVGALPTGIPQANVSGLTSQLANLDSTGNYLGSLAVANLTGLATGVGTWLAGGGSLPSTAGLGVGQLTGLATGIEAWLTAGGALPSSATAAISQITSLGGYLAHLSTSGVLALAGLGTGALPSGITLAGSELTGLASGIGAWLTGGGVLPSATSLGIGQLTGLATGIEAWLASGGALPSATQLAYTALTGLGTGVSTFLGTALSSELQTLASAGTLAVGQLSGLATGVETWLAAAGALPSSTSMAGTQLTGALNTAITVAGQQIGDVQADLARSIYSLFPVIGDAFWGGVVALLHMDGANGSTTFTDSSSLAAPFNALNGAVISTAQSKFGGASASFPNSNSYLVPTAPSSEFAFGTGDFTVEMWAYLNAGAGTANYVLFDVVGGPRIYTGSGFLVFFANGGNQIVGGSFATGGWHHVAACRASGTTRLFLDGTQVGTSYADSNNYSASTVTVGNLAALVVGFEGYIDEVRITNGFARYTSNFTPPTAAFPASGVTGGIENEINSALSVAGKELGSVLAQLDSAGNYLGSLAVSEVTGLATGIGSWLTAGGALPSATALATSQLTGLATGVETWLTGGGALPSTATIAHTAITDWTAALSAASIALSQVTGFATGVETWLAAGGALPSATALAVGQLSGLAAGVETWLAGAGALPSSASMAGTQLTGALNTALTLQGEALSSLFNSSGHFIGTLDATATGALNTALTYGGTALSTVLSGIDVTTGNFSGTVTGAVDSAATIAGQAASTVQANAQGALNSIVQGIDNVGGVADQTVEQAQTALSGFMTGLFNSWSSPSQTKSTASASDVATAAAQSVSTINNQASVLNHIGAQLPSFYGGSGTGNLTESIYFSGSLPSGFTAVTSSPLFAAGAVFNTTANTDTQSVSGAWTVMDGYAKYLFLRANSALTTLVYAKIQANDPSTGAANCEIGCLVAGSKTVFTTFALPSDLVLNSAYTLTAVDRTFTVTGPSTLEVSVTDSSVSQFGATYRSGGFGSDGFAATITQYYTPGTATYTVPTSIAYLDLGVCGGGAGGQGGQGGGVGGYTGLGGNAGTWAVQRVVPGTDFTSTTLSITVGSGGGGGSNNGGGGGNGTLSEISAPSGTAFSLTGNPGTGQTSGYNGASPANVVLENQLYAGGAAGPAGNPGGGGGQPGAGGGGGSWSGYPPANYVGGNGGAGIVQITEVSTSQPGSLGFWSFYDAAAAGPASAEIDTAESTTSTTYGSLTTVGPTATINVGPSGMVILVLSCLPSNATSGDWCYMSFVASGANTIAASDTKAFSFVMPLGAGGILASRFLFLRGLTAGATTFEAQYRVSAGTGTFSDRELIAIPL